MQAERRAGAPASGGEAFPPESPAPFGLGHQTHAVYTGRESSSSDREGTGQRTQIRSPRPADPSESAPGCTAPSAPASGRGRGEVAERAAGRRGGGASRLTCEARHERAEPEQTGVEGRGHPRHGARRSAGARGGDGAGPRPGTAAACRALRSGSRRPRPGWPAPRRHHPPRWPAGTLGVVAARDAPSPSPPRLLSAPLPFCVLRRPPLFSAFSSPLSPRAATRSAYG